MKLNINFIENEIDLSNEWITTIEIENKQLFYRLVDILNKYSNGEYDEDLFEDKTKIRVIIDYFNLDYNDKKNVNSIIKIIKNNTDEQKRLELNKYYNKLLNVYASILKEIDVPLEIDKDINIENIIKIINFKIVLENNILKNLFTLIDITKNTRDNDILIFINLKQYLTKEELNELYKYAIYNQAALVIIDSQTYGIALNFEKKLIIDENLEEYML